MRAALNHAFHDSKAPSDIEWRKVKPFKKVDAARVRYLTIAEAKRLINAVSRISGSWSKRRCRPAPAMGSWDA